MLGRTMALLALTAAGLLAATLTEAQRDAHADGIIGRWDITVQGAGVSYPSWLEVARSQNGLTGRFVGRSGSARPIQRIEFADGQIIFSLPVQWERQSKDLVFKGRLAGNQIEGTTESADGKPLTWRAVRAPELKAPAAPVWGAPIQLFNGRDLTGWKLRHGDRGNCWSVADGVLANSPPCVDIITEQKFKDFKLHIEFNYVEKSNSGVYLRGRYEVQIQDDYGKEPESHRIGGLYGFLTPTVNVAKKPGEWQSYDITLLGRRVTVALNGQTIIQDQEIPGITGGALDSEEGAPGPIMLQGDHGKISFRNIVLTPAK
jgi:hypothetical protein